MKKEIARKMTFLPCPAQFRKTTSQFFACAHTQMGKPGFFVFVFQTSFICFLFHILGWRVCCALVPGALAFDLLTLNNSGQFWFSLSHSL